MTTLDMLHAAILDEPGVDLHRLAYADALEERGGEGDLVQAEFIREQLTHPSVAQLLWADASHAIAHEGMEFLARRGFLEEVRCPLVAWRRYGTGLVHHYPITKVALTNREPRLSGPDLFVDGYGWQKWWSGGRRGRHVIPAWLWAHVPPRGRWDRGYGHTAEDAYAILSDACIAWAKSQPAKRRRARKGTVHNKETR